MLQSSIPWQSAIVPPTKAPHYIQAKDCHPHYQLKRATTIPQQRATLPPTKAPYSTRHRTAMAATQTYPWINLGGNIVASLGHLGQQQRPDSAPVVRIIHFRDGLEACFNKRVPRFKGHERAVYPPFAFCGQAYRVARIWHTVHIPKYPPPYFQHRHTRSAKDMCYTHACKKTLTLKIVNIPSSNDRAFRRCVIGDRSTMSAST